MARTPQEEYQKALDTLERAVESGDVAEADAQAIRRLCRAYDATDARENLPTDMGYRDRAISHKKRRTLQAWCGRLTEAARHVTLTDADADDVNALTTTWVKDDDDKSRSRVRNVEYAVSKLYRFHDDLGADPDEITVHQPDADGGNGWDERDLLDADERAALRKVADHPRDRAVLHLLLYCGMRNTALRTLRVRDIDLDEHVWYFNTASDGLKDIHRPAEPRPLCQAERAVREYLEAHPDPAPDHHLITGKQSASKKDPTRPVTRETVRYTMETLKERTAERDDVVTVEKPCHPHMMRHNFVSNKRKHPGVDDRAIKFWIGHAEASDVMQTTYSHLSSDDHNETGHDAFGVADAGGTDDTPDPWDETCVQCNRVVHPDADECDMCGADPPELPFDTSPGDDDLPGDGLRSVVREEVRDMLAPDEPDGDLTTEERAEKVRQNLGLD
jgi:integrase